MSSKPKIIVSAIVKFRTFADMDECWNCGFSGDAEKDYAEKFSKVKGNITILGDKNTQIKERTYYRVVVMEMKEQPKIEDFTDEPDEPADDEDKKE